MACRCRVRVILYNTAVINALLRAQTGVTYNHPAGHIYMPVAIRKCNYLAYIYAFRSRRIKQGCPLSPILFNLVMEVLIRAAESTEDAGYSIANSVVKTLAYPWGCWIGWSRQASGRDSPLLPESVPHCHL